MNGRGRPFVAVITADHGESLGESTRWFHGQTLAPELLAVPLVVLGEGVVPGRVTGPIANTAIRAHPSGRRGCAVSGVHGCGPSFSRRVGGRRRRVHPNVPSESRVATRSRWISGLAGSTCTTGWVDPASDTTSPAERPDLVAAMKTGSTSRLSQAPTQRREPRAPAARAGLRRILTCAASAGISRERGRRLAGDDRRDDRGRSPTAAPTPRAATSTARSRSATVASRSSTSARRRTSR